MTTTPQENAARPRTIEPTESRSATGAPARASRPIRRGVKGRRFVLGALGVTVVAWVVIYAILAPWMWSRNKRIEYGRKEVAPVVLEFKEIRPPGADARDWDRAVGDAFSLIVGAVRPGGLTMEAEKAIRDDVLAAVDRAKARPETAVTELADLWDRIASRAGKVRPAGSPDVGSSYPKPEILATAAGR